MSQYVGWRDQTVSYAVPHLAWCPIHAPKSIDHGDAGRRPVTRDEALRVGYRCEVCGELLAESPDRGQSGDS